MEKRKRYAMISALVIFIFVITGFFHFQKNTNFFENLAPAKFEVTAWNFDLWYKKIPVTEDHIDFTFSYDLDETSIQNFESNIEGKISMLQSNVLRYTFLEKNKTWDELSISFLKWLQTKKWRALESDIHFLIEIVSWAKVLKITPSWELNNLWQSLAVFFNIPMVPLTDLDSRDSLPCPIVIEPKIEWKCSWTTTSVLEFTPNDSFVWATKYSVKVEDREGLLYKLQETKEIELSTTKLQAYFSQNFAPTEGININFNFPVSIDELKSKFKLFENKIWAKNKSPALDVKVLKISDTHFSLSHDGFTYNSQYTLEIATGLKSKNGNISTTKPIFQQLKTIELLDSIDAYQNIYSSTWVLLDSTYQRNKSKIANKDLFFHLNFYEEVELNKTNFSFSSNNEKIDFDISYREEKKYNKELKKDEVVINKKKIKLTLKTDLNYKTAYTLQVLKVINKSLTDDIVTTYDTTDKLIVKDLKFINYSKTCLYLNNEINAWKQSVHVYSTSPESIQKWVSGYQHIPYKLKWKPDQELEELWYCRKAKSWEFLYVLNTRLNPHSSYLLAIENNFVDIYNNSLENTLEYKVETKDILDKDKYLYSGLSNDVNTIPDNLPIVMNLQSINNSEAHVEVCEMDEINYIYHLANRYQNWYVKKCNNTQTKQLQLKNYNWNLSNNRFDLEEDILGTKFTQKFIIVSAWTHPWQDKFETTYKKSNLSVYFEKASNKNLLYITDFGWNSIPNLNLKFYKTQYNKKSYKQEDSVVTPKSTYVNGVYEIENSDFSYVAASWENNYWFLNLRYDSFSNYDFKYISGESSSQKDYLYLYTERPIYKPGDIVYFKWLLRYFSPTWYTKSKSETAKLELIDPSGKSIASKDITIDDNSNFSGEFIIPAEVNLWKFRFRFTGTADKNSVRNNAFFHIEEYRKPDFKLETSESKKDFILWDSVQIQVKPEYYFGGKIINTSWKYSILTQNYFFDAKDYSDYNFWEWYKYFECVYWGYCNYRDKLIDTSSFDIHDDGTYNLVYKFDDNFWEKLHRFNIEVTDPDTKRVVNKSVSKILHTTDAYVGIKTNYYNSKESWIDINWVVLNFDAQVLANKKVKLELIKREWKSVKKKWVDGVFYNDYSLEEIKEKDIFTSTNTLGEFKKNIKTKTSWEYLIKAIYTWKNNKEFISSKVVYVAWADYIIWPNENNSVTELVADKLKIKVGDTAEYMLKTPVSSWKALFIVEKDDAILDYFIHDIQSFSDKITIDVKDTYYPNYYLRAYLIWQQEGNPLPIYKRALTVTKVDTEDKKIFIDIKTDKQKYLPWEKVKLDIQAKDKNWNPIANTNLSISLVDESLLALKWNPRKNPYAFFYDMKRYLWTYTYGSLKTLIEKLEVKDTSDGEKWWAWDRVKWWDSKKKRGTFKDTAYWSADVTTDTNWKVSMTTTNLPDNLTTWVIETLANTSIGNKVWVTYTTIITSKELLINDNLPRFFVSNDSIMLSPVVFNKTGKDQIFSVMLSATNLKNISENKQKIFIKNGDQKTVHFDVTVDDIGLSEKNDFFFSTLTFKAVSEDNQHQDEIEKKVQIHESSTQESVSTFWKTKNDSFEQKLELGNINSSKWKITANYSATLLSNLTDGIDYLNRYPYGCSEQKTSAIMPNIFIKKLYSSVWEEYNLQTKMLKYWAWEYEWYSEKSIDQTIKEYLVNIRKYQKYDGGFVYWYDVSYWPNYSDFDLSSYILQSAASIREIWYKLEEAPYYKTTKYLKTRFYKNYIEWCQVTEYNDCKYSEIDRMKAISAILSFDTTDYEAYKMWKLLEIDKTYSNTVKLEKVKLISQLLKVQEINKDERSELEKEAKQIVDKIISEELVFNPRGAFIGKTSYYSAFRNTVSLLEAVSTIWLEKFDDLDSIVDNINRWIISNKKDGSFWSTQDNIALIKGVTKYIESSGELKNIKFHAKLKINNDTIAEKNFDENNKMEVYSTSLKTDNIKSSSNFTINKSWKWTVYYDLNLSYYKDTKDIKARDEWFFVERYYYDYNEYNKIYNLKKEENKKYHKWEASYKDLKYPKDIYEYLAPIKLWNVWDLIVVRNKIITSETRNKVAFEWFIPAGSELVNPNLSTSTKATNRFNNNLFQKQEYRTDRYFAYTDRLYNGIHNFSYLIRLTHAWEYHIKPTKISEFYNVEVFWRTRWEIFKVK